MAEQPVKLGESDSDVFPLGKNVLVPCESSV
jgi:hypothetical protein